MSTTSAGREAESKVATELERRGYKLVEHNWRTRYCEIDLVMSKNRVMYFIEVKYRSSIHFGDGAEYVTSRKMQQMIFAAEMWQAIHEWSGDMQIMVASVEGASNEIKIFEV